MADFFPQALDEMNIPYDQKMIAQLERHVSEIELFNPVYKLVTGDIRVRHVLDSLSGYHEIRKIKGLCPSDSFTVADLGSGAGFPGIPLAIVMPDVHFTLVERMGRRAGFLRNVIAATGLSGRVDLIESDIKEVKRKFNLVVMRAFHPLCNIASEASALLAAGGSILAWKTTEDYLDHELAELEQKFPGRFSSSVTPVSVPGLDRPQKLCRLCLRQSVHIES
ncbi:MAG: 16S rRNA (guanine(527)-N(7))-methyltransferase RsmG [Sphaerochaetaceae bacterium]|nr:16S rRNA (guanine(527)-N(7))-methyltransferase RsmG [Sphaerochaetaceae bacterium]